MIHSTLALAAARGALVLGAALAAMPLLRRASASTRRLVLVAAFGAVLVMPLVSALGPSLRIALPAVATPSLASDAVTLAPEPVAHGDAVADDSSAAGVAASPGASRDDAPRDSSWTPSPLQVALSVWALGVLFVVARLASGIVRARRLASGAERVATASLGSRVVEVRMSAAIETPAVTGLFAPVVLLPRESLAWTDERRHVVLLHELAHVAQKDCLASVVAQLVCALHWFNPLAWLAARRLRIERELAADDLVLRGGARASSYAQHLLAIATAHVDARPVPTGALGMAQRSRSQIEERIRALLVVRRARAPLGRATRTALAACAMAMLFAVACATPDRSAPPAASQAASAAAAPSPIVAVADGKTTIQRRGGVPVEAIMKEAGGASGHAELTLDAELQAMAEDETDRMTAEWKTRGAVVIVMDPDSGAVLALTSRSPDANAEMAARAMNPGSTMKPFVVAAALEEGAIKENQKFDCENGKRAYGKQTLHDAAPHATLDVGAILAVSSNIGAAKIFDQLGGAKLVAWTHRFHFGERAPLQLPNVASGAVPQRIDDRSMLGARVAIGEGLTASPMQIAAAFASIANGGTYRAPTLVRRVVDATGRVTWQPSAEGERVMRAETARAVMTMLEGVVTRSDGTGQKARVEGVRVAGKTGTADLPHAPGTPEEEEENYASFVGAAPADHPKYVVLVGAEAPRDHGWGGSVAAPVFARIVARALAK